MKRLRFMLPAIAIVLMGLSAQAQVAIGARGGVSLAKTIGNGGFIENFTGKLDYIECGIGALFLQSPIGGGLADRAEIG